MSKRGAIIEETCCICSNTFPQTNVTQLKNRDDNETDLLTKLCTSVPRIVWDPSFHICLTCKATLNIVYTFIETCLKSDFIQRQQLKNTKTCKINQEKRKVYQPILDPKDPSDDDEDVRAEVAIESIIVKPDIEEIKCENDGKESVENICIVLLNEDELDENQSAESGSKSEAVENPPIKCYERRSYSVKCDYCYFKFSSTAELLMHCQTEHQEDGQPFACDISEHEAVKKPANKFRKRRSYRIKCDNCDLIFTSAAAVLMHCKTKHPTNPEDVQSFACETVLRKFQNASNFVQHQNNHDAVRYHLCTYCGKSFNTGDLRSHEKQHLNKREYQCDKCGKAFNTHQNIRTHRIMVHSDPSLWKHVCEVCGKRFPVGSSYRKHARRHVEPISRPVVEKKFACSLCPWKFSEKFNLDRHMKTHSGIKDFKCPTCAKEYRTKHRLKVHMVQIHQADVGPVTLPNRKKRNYQCHICPQAYHDKHILQRHLYAHSGEKPFPCNRCNRRFHDKVYLKKHLRRIHRLTQDDIVMEIVKLKVDQN